MTPSESLPSSGSVPPSVTWFGTWSEQRDRGGGEAHANLPALALGKSTSRGGHGRFEGGPEPVCLIFHSQRISRNYQHHLKIFTDGSVMEDGAAGAAFVIPEFNNLTHSYTLPAVSIFTAEQLAILMALQYISEIPVTPFAIVI